MTPTITENSNEKEFLHPNNRQELRSWLMQNSTTKKEVFVHCIRRPHPTILSYLDVVEEALCFGWIDSVCQPCEGEGYFQRISPRRKGSPWTELNKERCRRLIRLGLMTPAGRKVLPSLAKNSFQPEAWIVDAIKADKEAWQHHRSFPSLYVRVRLYNILFYWNRNAKGDKEKAIKMLERYIQYTHEGKMYGDWNDGGRLTMENEKQ